jgi:hypothetical protein
MRKRAAEIAKGWVQFVLPLAILRPIGKRGDRN